MAFIGRPNLRQAGVLGFMNVEEISLAKDGSKNTLLLLKFTNQALLWMPRLVHKRLFAKFKKIFCRNAYRKGSGGSSS